jgi:hypothetical protein
VKGIRTGELYQFLSPNSVSTQIDLNVQGIIMEQSVKTFKNEKTAKCIISQLKHQSIDRVYLVF